MKIPFILALGVVAGLASCGPQVQQDANRLSREMSQVTVESVPFPSGPGQLAWIEAQKKRIAEESCVRTDYLGRCLARTPPARIVIAPSPTVTSDTCQSSRTARGLPNALAPVVVTGGQASPRTGCR